jgi:SOS-response transcriptional repressor LexA
MLKSKELGRAIDAAIKLKLACGAAKSKTEIARHFGIKPPSIYDWINKGSISKDKLPELWAYFSDVVTMEHWGLQASNLPANLKNLVADRRINTRPIGDVPILDWDQIICWIQDNSKFDRGSVMTWIPCPICHDKMTYSLTVQNEAMMQPNGKPSFLPGDVIFVDPSIEPNNNSFVIAYNTRTYTTKLRKLIIDGDDFYLNALNPSWPERMQPIDRNTTYCGVVIYKGEQIAY